MNTSECKNIAQRTGSVHSANIISKEDEKSCKDCKSFVHKFGRAFCLYRHDYLDLLDFNVACDHFELFQESETPEDDGGSNVSGRSFRYDPTVYEKEFERKICSNCNYSRKIEDYRKVFCVKNNCDIDKPNEKHCNGFISKYTETFDENKVELAFCDRYMNDLNHKNIQILGHEWQIEVVKFNEHEYLKKHDAEGVAKPHLRKIIISDGTDKTFFFNDDERLIRFKHCLRHEIIHAFLEESGLAACSTKIMKPWARNEEMVDWFAKMSIDIYKVYGSLGLLD